MSGFEEDTVRVTVGDGTPYDVQRLRGETAQIFNYGGRVFLEQRVVDSPQIDVDNPKLEPPGKSIFGISNLSDEFGNADALLVQLRDAVQKTHGWNGFKRDAAGRHVPHVGPSDDHPGCEL